MNGGCARRMGRLVVILALLCGVAAAQPFETQKPRLGVLPLASGRDDAAFATLATEALVEELVGSQLFDVLDHSGMVMRYAEMVAGNQLEIERFQEALGQECSANDCIIEIGQEIATQYMAGGSVRRELPGVFAYVKLIDIERNGLIVTQVSQVLPGTKSVDLRRGVSDLAAKLLRGVVTPVNVVGIPRDATVLVDGEVETRWVAGAPIPVPVGPRTITAKRRGYRDRTVRVNVTFGRQNTVDLSLTPKSRMSAVSRSFLVPGAGQRYSDRRGVALLFQATEGIAFCGAVAAVVMNRRANDDYDAARTEYLNLGEDGSTVDVATYARKRAAMEEKWDVVNRTSTYFYIAAGAFAGLHVLNVLDAWINFPDLGDAHVSLTQPPARSVGVGLCIEPSERNGR